MATSGVISGTDLRLYNGANAIGYATSCTLDFSMETTETIHKDNVSGSSTWQSVTPGTKSGTVTVEALMNEDADTALSNRDDARTLYTALANGTKLFMSVKTATSGDVRWQFYAYCTAFSLTGPVDENATYSATFTIDGAPTLGSFT